MWGVVIALPLALVGWRWFAAMGRSRRATTLLARAVLIAILCAMLAGLSRVRRTQDLAVVAVVDVSDSVRTLARGGGEYLDRVRAFLERASAKRTAEDLLGVVAFDGRALAIATPSRGNVLERPLDVRGGEGTDIGEAIRLARSLLPPDASGRLVLFSDGNQTIGDAIGAANETAGWMREGALGRGVAIDVVPVRYDIASEVVVEGVDSPQNAPAGATVPVRVSLSSTGRASGVLRLTREGESVAVGGGAEGAPVMSRRVELEAGRRVEVLEARLPAGRVHRLRAVFEPDAGAEGYAGDTLTENNTGESFTITPGGGEVLILDGVGGGSNAGGGGTLARTLEESGLSVTMRPAEGLPEDLLALQAYDLIITQNVPAEAMSPEAHARLVAYVREMGGGLLMVGGPDALGAGGWKGTSVEAILPVRLDLPERLVSPEAATVFVIDNSGSMGWNAAGTGRSKQEIANEATALAISRLDRSDLVGLITFNNEFTVRVALAPNLDAEKNAEVARNIGTGGGTNIGPALDEAFRQIRGVDAKVKHIIVVTDGRSRGRETLAAQAAVIAAQGIKVSTIAVGEDADTDVMQAMAEQGKGTYYNAYNANALPRIFLKAVRVVRSPQIREAPFTPRLGSTSSALTQGLGAMPALNGLVLTQARGEPTITTALVTPQGEPVFAYWNVELGRVGVFTSDAHRWGESWVSWSGYAPFWSQTARALARPTGGRGLTGTSRIEGGVMKVRVEASEEGGRPIDGLTMPGTVYGPSGKGTAVELAQVGPGVYEAAVPVRESGTMVTVVRPRQGGRLLTPVLAGALTPTGNELRTLRSNEGLMQRIAAITGGRRLDMASPETAGLFDRSGVTPQEAVTLLWRTLCIWAIVMLLLDIATRRIAWDRWTSREFGAEVAAGVREAVRDRGGAARASMERLVASREAVQESPGSSRAAGPSMTLGEEEAKALAEAARDRRRASRLAGLSTPDAGGESTQDAVSPPEPGGEGLLAAKRRARQKFEEDGVG